MNKYSWSEDFYRYLGEQRDYDQGVDYLHARYYNYAMDKFMSVDPVIGEDKTNPLSWNGYQYGYDNPMTFSDPFGMRINNEGNKGFQAGAESCEVDPKTGIMECGFGESVEVQGESRARSAFRLSTENALLSAYLDRLDFLAWANSYVNKQRFPNFSSYGLFTQDWWQKFKGGYYFGTGYTEEALDYYADILTDPQATLLEEAGAGAGGAFSALWLPNTYYKTYSTFLSAALLSKYLANTGKIYTIRIKFHLKGHPGGPHKKPHIQIFRHLKRVKGSNTKAWRRYLWW